MTYTVIAPDKPTETIPTEPIETHDSDYQKGFSDEKLQIPSTTKKVCHSTAQRLKITKNETWNILYANVRGFKSKIKSINQILLEQRPHLFMITETQLRSNTGISLEGYSFYGRKRDIKILFFSYY